MRRGGWEGGGDAGYLIVHSLGTQLPRQLLVLWPRLGSRGRGGGEGWGVFRCRLLI